MPITSYTFTTPANYTFPATVEVSGGKAQLSKQDLPAQTFTEPFTSDSGFTYNSSYAEFTGGLVRQIDKQPSNSIAWATYTSTVNLSWIASGTKVPVLTGSPTIVANKLDCTGGTNRKAVYTNSNIGSITNTGAYKFKFTPNYSGTPVSNCGMVSIGESGNNTLMVFHSTSGGTIRISAWDSTGANIHLAAIIGSAWVPVSGTTYEFEINFTASTGVIEVYIDGIYKGATPTTTFTRTGNNILAVGSNLTYTCANGSFEDVILYNTVQHSGGAGGNYTPGYTLEENRFVNTTIILPQFIYSGVGNIQSYDSFATTEGNTPRYIINDGADKYWNGSAWTSSDGSWAQSNTATDVNTNISSFTPVDDPIIKVVFEGGDVQMSVDNLILTYTGQIYSTTNPAIKPNSPLNTDGITTFTTTITEPGTDTITFTIEVDGVEKYWNGSAWVNSSGYTQSNTATEINTNITSLSLTLGAEVKPVAYLHSNDGSTTPDLDIITLTYNFFGPEDTGPDLCTVFFYFKDIHNNPISGATIEARANEMYPLLNKNQIISKHGDIATSDVNGYVELNLIPSADFDGDGLYYFTINEPNKLEEFFSNITVPSVSSVNLGSIV